MVVELVASACTLPGDTVGTAGRAKMKKRCTSARVDGRTGKFQRFYRGTASNIMPTNAMTINVV